MPPEYRSHWLAPTLAAFRALHPRIDLQPHRHPAVRSVSREAELAIQPPCPMETGRVAVRLQMAGHIGRSGAAHVPRLTTFANERRPKARTRIVSHGQTLLTQGYRTGLPLLSGLDEEPRNIAAWAEVVRATSVGRIVSAVAGCGS